MLGTTGAWGNCVNITRDDDYVYVTTNLVPNYYFSPYCPLALYGGYCIGPEKCPFEGMQCGLTVDPTGKGYTALGDVWVSQAAYYKAGSAGGDEKVCASYYI